MTKTRDLADLGGGFIQAGTGARQRTVESKLQDVVSVKDFGAVGNGTADDTAAFNAAIATGKRVFVPAGSYLVADINAISGMYIEGDKNDNSALIVKTSNSGAFTAAAAYNITIKRLRISAGSGVTNARAYKQTDKSEYTAYAVFSEIETYADLEVSFDGNFIFTSWEKCRDGYSGNLPVAHSHNFITSAPATFGQVNSTNLNQILKCQIFRSSATLGAVILQYGASWTIRDCDFENCSTRPLYIAGIYNIHVSDCWIENCSSTGSLIQLDASAAPNARGVRVAELNNLFIVCHPSNTSFVDGSWANVAAIRNIALTSIPAGFVISTAAEHTNLEGVVGLSGNTSSLLLNKKQAISLANIRNSEIEGTVINSPNTANINVLPIGPTSLMASNLNTTGFIAAADVTSAFKGQAVRFAMAGVGHYAWFPLPAKLRDFLRGKTITLCVSGYGEAGNVPDGGNACIWDSVNPPAAPTAVGAWVDASSTALQSGYVTHTVSTGCTVLYVGIYIGGANAGGKGLILETMSLFLGEIKPLFAGL